MSDVPAWGFYSIVALQFVAMLLIGHRCDILSRRIDIVHKRITMNNRINGLNNSGWGDDDDATSQVTSDQCQGGDA